VQQSSDQNSIIVSHILKNDPKIESVRFPKHNKKREREREIKRKKRKGDKKNDVVI